MPAPELLRKGEEPTEIPHFQVIEARMFKRNILYYLFFLRDRMVFVETAKSSFLIDNQTVISGGFSRLLAIGITFIVVFIFLVIFGNAPTKSGIKDTFEFFLVAILIFVMPSAMGYTVFRYYLKRIYRSRRYNPGFYPRKGLKVIDLLRLSNRKRDIRYSNINSVHLEEMNSRDPTFGEENSRGYLMFDLNLSTKKVGIDYQNENNTISDRFMVYNIPLYENITDCKMKIDRFILHKSKNKQRDQVANLGYTISKERRLQKILRILLAIGGIGCGIAFRRFHELKLDNEFIMPTLVGVGLVFLFLYVFKGIHWYKPNYFLYWSEKKRIWHAKYADKLLIIFIVAIIICITPFIMTYVTQLDPTFEKKQPTQTPYNSYLDKEHDERINEAYDSFKQKNSINGNAK